MTAPSTGIGAQANGLVRQAFAAIEAEHLRFIKAAGSIPPSVYGALARGTTVTRNRAAARIEQIMGCEPWLEGNRFVIYRFARIIRQPLSDDKSHQGVEIAWMCFGQSRGVPVVTDRPANLFVSWHACGRLLEREGFDTDILATVLDSHGQLLEGPFAAFDTIHENRIWSIPAASGCFVTDVHIVRTYDEIDAAAFLRGWTYLDNTMLEPWQRAQCDAIRFRGDGPTLGSGLFMPPQMRPAAKPEGNRVWLPHGSTETFTPSRLRRQRPPTGA